jgi:hypothetical protein
MNAAQNNINMIAGMTDSELELACEDLTKGVARWVHWTSEIYCLGKCLRFWTKYPKFLPLFVYSDHGVTLPSHLRKHELENPAKVHFTWNPMREQRYKDFSDKQVIQIIHPWISYRRLKGITRSKTTSGTLVFYAHSTNNVKWVGHDTEEYFEELRKLPNKFQPVVLCLHMHDIRAGLHKKLRHHGLPIVTAGNTLSVDFVDHFYDIVKGYSYATSQAWGSNVAYCVELGIPYFFLGKKAELFNISDKNLPEGVVPSYWDSCHEQYVRKTDALFSAPMDSVTNDQRVFVESILGLNSKLSREQVSRILWREFFHNWQKWYLVPMGLMLIPFRMVGLEPMLKKIRGYIS